MDNIKYIFQMVMPNPFTMKPYVDGYFIRFNDNSEIHLFLEGYFDTTDCTKGKNRNDFKKLNTPKQAIQKINDLIKVYGWSDTDEGDVVIVNSNNVKTKIILD